MSDYPNADTSTGLINSAPSEIGIDVTPKRQDDGRVLVKVRLEYPERLRDQAAGLLRDLEASDKHLSGVEGNAVYLGDRCR